MTRLKDKLFSWGYVLDKTPTAAPFVFGKTRCSLETAAAYLGVHKAFYMNSMFNVDYVRKHFRWDQECLDNCIAGRMSDAQLTRLADIDEVFCTLEHDNYFDSALQIAERSLQFRNIKGIQFDDFNQSRDSPNYVSPATLRDIRRAIRTINPILRIAIVTYSHLPVELQITPFVEDVDIVSRWCWIPSQDYWNQHADDIKKVRDVIGNDKQLIQGLYIHDFGTSMFCQYPVPLEIFRKSLIAACENTCGGFVGWVDNPTDRLVQRDKPLRACQLDETVSRLVRCHGHLPLNLFLAAGGAPLL